MWIWLVFVKSYFIWQIHHAKSFKMRHVRDHSSITSSKRWVGGVRKWQFLMIYSTANHQRGEWVDLKKSKTWWRNTWMPPYVSALYSFSKIFIKCFKYSILLSWPNRTSEHDTPLTYTICFFLLWHFWQIILHSRMFVKILWLNGTQKRPSANYWSVQPKSSYAPETYNVLLPSGVKYKITKEVNSCPQRHGVRIWSFE